MTDTYPAKKQVLDDAIGQKIVDTVNAALKQKYEYCGWHDGNVKLKSKRGVVGMIVCYNPNQYEYIIRSVLFPKNRFYALRYLCNGQAGTNAREAGRWPENHLTYIYTDEEIKQRMELSFGENAAKLIANGTIRDPYESTARLRALRKLGSN